MYSNLVSWLLLMDVSVKLKGYELIGKVLVLSSEQAEGSREIKEIKSQLHLLAKTALSQ